MNILTSLYRHGKDSKVNCLTQILSIYFQTFYLKYSQSCTVAVLLCLRWTTVLTYLNLKCYKGNSVFFFLFSLCCLIILSSDEKFRFSVKLRKRLCIKCECWRVQKIKNYCTNQNLTYVKFANRSHLN